MKLQVKYFRGVIFVCEGVSHDCGVKLVYTQIKLSCKFGFLHWEKKLNEMSTNRYEDIPNCQTLNYITKLHTNVLQKKSR